MRDGAGIIAATTDLALGSTISYTFLVDFDQPASETYYSGTTFVFPDYSGDYDYFYIDLIGTGEIESTGAFKNKPTDGSEYNLGMVYPEGSSYRTDAWTDSDDDEVYLYKGSDIHMWQIGDDGFTIDERATDSTGTLSIVKGTNLTLVSVSPAAVPVPPAIILGMVGLLGVGGLRRFHQL